MDNGTKSFNQEPISSEPVKAISGKEPPNETNQRSTVITPVSVTLSTQEIDKETHCAAALMNQCKTNMSFEKLDNAIEMLRDVRSRRPAAHPLYIYTMRQFASAFTVKLFYTNQIAGINDVIFFYKNTTIDDIKKPKTLVSVENNQSTDDDIVELAGSYIAEFNASISRADVDGVVTSLQTCLPLPPTISHDTRLQVSSTLADALYTRFRQSNSRSLADLASANQHLSNAFQYCDYDSRMRSDIMLRTFTLFAENWELLARQPPYMKMPSDSGKAAQNHLAKDMHDICYDYKRQARA